MMLRRVKIIAASCVLSLGGMGSALAGQTYTKNADFDWGQLKGVDHAPPNDDQLQITLGDNPIPPPFMWVANFADGTVTKISTDTGGQVAKYHSVLMRNWDGSVPQGITLPIPGADCNSPSRTTVDGDDNAFVANRGFCTDSTTYTRATVTKFAGSLGYCVDRNGNGLIDTSRDVNGDGVIGREPPEFLGQADECILWTRNYAEKGDLGRSVAIDGDQNIWLGGYSSSKLWKLDGKTGALLQTIDLNAEKGTIANIYGLAVGPEGFIYTSDLTAKRLRKIDPKAPVGRRVVAEVGVSTPTYGLAVDRDGVAWLGSWADESPGRGGVLRVDFKTGKEEKILVSSSTDCTGLTRGVAVAGNGDIWVACYSTHKLLHFRRSRVTGSVFFNKSYATDSGTLGVTIDDHQRIWTSNYDTNSVTRVDPGAGRVQLSRPAGGIPYSYWDMSGYQYRNSTIRQGEWVVVQEGERLGAQWGTIHWNRESAGSVPAETAIEVSVQASDDSRALSSQPVFPVTRGVSFTGAGVTGRYLRVRAVLRTKNLTQSPVLSDLSIIPSWSWGESPAFMCEGTVDGTPPPHVQPCAIPQVGIIARWQGVHCRWLYENRSRIQSGNRDVERHRSSIHRQAAPYGDLAQ
ncbi:hypothetical protein [Archangium primigenium]|uniref:Vgb family protein n=1 Tax=[Archangium] primigenium TaxID=2792470 RepID=UPI00195A66CD|nr:hypothetical protein [Archangium primigenium]MBM7113227.1 hypothetical protein [Archangium primigenium]